MENMDCSNKPLIGTGLGESCGFDLNQNKAFIIVPGHYKRITQKIKSQMNSKNKKPIMKDKDKGIAHLVTELGRWKNAFAKLWKDLKSTNKQLKRERKNSAAIYNEYEHLRDSSIPMLIRQHADELDTKNKEIAMLRDELFNNNHNVNTEKLSTVIHEGLGEASMCWSERPKGIFDGSRTMEIGSRILNEVLKTVNLNKEIIHGPVVWSKESSLDEDIAGLEAQLKEGNNKAIVKAVDILKEAFRVDDAFKYGWISNIACSVINEWQNHNSQSKLISPDDIVRIGNKAAENFLWILTERKMTVDPNFTFGPMSTEVILKKIAENFETNKLGWERRIKYVVESAMDDCKDDALKTKVSDRAAEMFINIIFNEVHGIGAGS